jgi:Holliday junction DNA helicase RuvB
MKNLDPTNEAIIGRARSEKDISLMIFLQVKIRFRKLESLCCRCQSTKRNFRSYAFHGPPGLGKTSLANILANELEVGIKFGSGPVR